MKKLEAPLDNLLAPVGDASPPWIGEPSEEWINTCNQLVEELEVIPTHTKPPTEKALFNHQLNFYKNLGDISELEKLFILMVPYAGSLILKFKQHRNYISKKALGDMSYEVASRVVDQYLRRPGFIIGASFGGYIKWKILEVTGEADDLERVKQINPATGKQKIMPLLSLNAIIDKTQGKETSFEDLQSKLNFTFVGGGNSANWFNQFDTSLHENQTIEGIMKIVDTLLQFIENDTGECDYKTYVYKLFSILAFHVLFSQGIDSYQKFLEMSPSSKLSMYIEETAKEINAFLHDTHMIEAM